LGYPQLALTITQETKVADFNKPLWQQMQAEPAYKFPRQGTETLQGADALQRWLRFVCV
jgi:hypothetical protein